jgi:hypothetical protein
MSAREQLDRAKAQLARMKKTGEAAIVQFRTDAETIGAGTAAGYARGRYEDPNDPEQYQVLGLEPELLIGLPAKLAAYSGYLGTATPDVHAVSNGILTAYGALWALAKGEQHREEDRGAPTGRTRGRPAVGAGHQRPDGSIFEEIRRRARERAPA